MTMTMTTRTRVMMMMMVVLGVLREVPVKVEPSTVTEFLFVTDPKRFAPAQAGSDVDRWVGWLSKTSI